MFGFGWVGGRVTAKWVFGFKNPLALNHVWCFKTNRSFTANVQIFGWVGGWVATNPNIIRIFKSLGNNGRSLIIKIWQWNSFVRN